MRQARPDDTATRAANAAALMRRETQVTHGPVPDRIGGTTVADGEWVLIGDEFLLRAQGIVIYYRKGRAITVDGVDPAQPGNLQLYLSGTTHAAVACMNGLHPVHASAIVADGRAVGITGPSGAGKSTLSAALNGRGYALLADDTLILDMRGPVPICLPGHKRMKLWPDAVALTGAQAGEIVSPDYRKHYVTRTGSERAEPCPLAAMIVLESGPEFAFEPLSGGARIAALNDDHYVARLHEVVSGNGPAGRLAAIAALASAVPCWRFTRPMERDRFAEMLDFAERSLERVIRS